MAKPSRRLRAGRVGWYVDRLRTMSPPELAWRGATAARSVVAPGARVLRVGRPAWEPVADWEAALDGFRRATDRPVLLDRARARDIAARHPEEAAALVTAAERVLAGRVGYFGYPEVQLGDPVDWSLDPVSGTRWPLLPSHRLDHRTSHADPKWIWELNRLQHLPWLAEAWLVTGQAAFAERALDHLDSWVRQNPAGRGIAWRGAFELGVRAISVLIALQGLRDCEALTLDRFEPVVRMLDEGARRCWRDRSRFSSANNHLVGELAGLAVVAMMLPELKHARRWEDRALTGLCVEASRQILPDGAGAEQAVGYQVFTAELLSVVATLLRARGDQPPAAITEAVARSAGYLAAVVGADDPDPRYGDDDEGFALRLGPEPLRTVRDHLGLVGALTGDARARRAGRTTLSSAWVASVTGTAAESEPPEGGADAVLRGSFHAPDGGLVVLRAGRRRVTMDVGPLGYLSIAAHGHADALALTLSLDGREVLGDPGAGSYYGHPDWRRVHRGTRAHATVTVDGQDQSVMGGPFLWSRHARVRTRTVDLRRGLVDAEHDGYQRLPSPVSHRRLLVAPPDEDAVLVVDLLEGEGEHELCASWPLHPAVEVRAHASGHLLEVRDGPRLSLAHASTTTVRCEEVRGDTATNLGWWSERLESRTPAWLVSSSCTGRAPLALATVVAPVDGGDDPAACAPEVTWTNHRLQVTWRNRGATRTISLATRSGQFGVEPPFGAEARAYGEAP